ncbi:hypothetical protein HMPREF9622_01434 [Cutibacterium modestum HL037PA3]|uniref:Uncharacterized protein n=1 Tax=Cutibacterium modestum HL044PA1 TaxID=765109 RepID=A0ABN0C2S9_9ACTN|nr:hypothetical protein HMPREF9607_02401 [Cutibacterium modestum HL044PA1]EFT15437.1 hypothetical protein HMPREF9622_01434 [Cutibacterium modestum HL037PA3]
MEECISQGIHAAREADQRGTPWIHEAGDCPDPLKGAWGSPRATPSDEA